MYKYLLISLSLLIAGCGSWQFPGVYKVEIEQGNIITQEMIDQLKPGMSRSQVEFIMGSPLIKDTFNADRWDYVYLIGKGDEARQQKTFSIFFKNDALVRFSGDFSPTPNAEG